MNKEIAKKLKDFGLPQELIMMGNAPEIEGYLVEGDSWYAYPTTERLINFLPHHLKENFVLTIYKMEDKGYFVDYTDVRPETVAMPFKFGGIAEKMVGQSDKNLVDALAKMIIYLKENYLI